MWQQFHRTPIVAACARAYIHTYTHIHIYVYRPSLELRPILPNTFVSIITLFFFTFSLNNTPNFTTKETKNQFLKIISWLTALGYFLIEANTLFTKCGLLSVLGCPFEMWIYTTVLYCCSSPIRGSVMLHCL